jgi:hypothetical protein
VNRLFRRLAVPALAALVLVTTESAVADAATPPVRDPRILVHFDAGAGETPEGIALEPDGSADISLARAGTAVRVRRDGRVELLGRLPRTGACPGAGIGVPTSAGIARAGDGTVYLANCSGNADGGVWRLRRGHAPVQIARLPNNSFPNGMALDDRDRNLYLADSLLGVVWKVPAIGGTPTVWASGPALEPTFSFGANGLAVHHNAVWVSNTEQGTIVRIPIRRDGAAGPIRTAATGLPGVDNFTFLGEDDTIVAALVISSQVVLIRPGASPRVVLTAADGLSLPTHVQVRRNTLYVSSFGDFTSGQADANLLVAHIDRRCG